MIKFVFQNKLLQTSKDIESLPLEANIHLKLGLFSGQDCDICGIASAALYCSDCNQFFCSECCGRVYHHPKRISHNPSTCAIDTSTNKSTERLSQTSTNAMDDDNFCSQADISFHDCNVDCHISRENLV